MASSNCRSQIALPALRETRLRRGFSQSRLAMLAGMTQSDMSNIELARRPVGALRRLRLALVLGMPESILFGRPIAKAIDVAPNARVGG